MHRTTIARAAIAALLLFPAMHPTARAEDAPVAEQIVDAMNKLWGSHPGIRANHAKGVVLEGSFQPSAEGAKLSKASLFQGAVVLVTVRFSNATGVPTLPDGSPFANPHGMAIKFTLADGGEMDIVNNSLKFFPVKTGEELRDLLLAVAASGPDVAKPTPVETFFAAHPAAPAAFATVRTPSSFARETYNGVDAFVFVDAAGNRRPFRFQIAPVAGNDYLSDADAAKQAPDFLMQEIGPRVAKEPVQFHLLAQLAAATDNVVDATVAWPADREVVDLGTITVAKAVADSAAAEKQLLYLPGNLTDGIEASDDPLIAARNESYAVSYGRRSQ